MLCDFSRSHRVPLALRRSFSQFLIPSHSNTGAGHRWLHQRSFFRVRSYSGSFCSTKRNMLASPLYPMSSFAPQLASDDHSQFRPARDIEAFNSLLPPPIEFVEGSSSGTLAVAEGKYEPINTTPKASKNNVSA